MNFTIVLDVYLNSVSCNECCDFQQTHFTGQRHFQLTDKWQCGRTWNFLNQCHHPWSLFIIVEYPNYEKCCANKRHGREKCENSLKQPQHETVVDIVFHFFNHVFQFSSLFEQSQECLRSRKFSLIFYSRNRIVY